MIPYNFDKQKNTVNMIHYKAKLLIAILIKTVQTESPWQRDNKQYKLNIT